MGFMAILSKGLKNALVYDLAQPNDIAELNKKPNLRAEVGLWIRA
jgi:hypothetical protein